MTYIKELQEFPLSNWKIFSHKFNERFQCKNVCLQKPIPYKIVICFKGLTVQNVVIDFNDRFADCQAYVALSCVKKNSYGWLYVWFNNSFCVKVAICICQESHIFTGSTNWRNWFRCKSFNSRRFQWKCLK